MPQGTCRLCLKTSDLQDSHFVPKAFYKLARNAAEKNPNPLLVTPDVALKTSKQITDSLLCKGCEARFNDRGEKWVIANCWHSEVDFPIFAAISAEKPLYAGERGYRIYAGRAITGVDTDQLTYFAASVFWRGAVHRWNVITGHQTVKLDLGPYENELRLFLLGAADFPKSAAIMVNVSSTTKVVANEYMLLPFLKADSTTHRQHKFLIPGLGFELFTGNALPTAVRQMCMVRSPEGYIYQSEKLEDATLTGIRELVAKARTVGNLK